MEEKDIITKILDWKKQYENIYAATIAGELFVFRTINRKEFRNIQGHEEWTYQDKEEAYCETATLYPEGYDFSTCLAGIPVILTEKILSESLMLNDNRLKQTLNEYREDMKVYENQMDCLITEAFPTINLDEIQGWDMHKTLYYLSRAEFVLNKLRGLPFVSQDGETYDEIEEYEQGQTKHVEQSAPQEEYYVDDVFTKDIDEFNGSASMSMPNMKELSELQKICPEIDWLKEDSLLNGQFDFEEESKIAFSAEDV